MRNTFTSLFVLVMLILPSAAFAANLSIYPASVSLKQGDSVGFIVHLQSQTDVNTLGASVVLQKGLTYLSASQGDVFTQWVERPTFNIKDQSVSFAGIMSNGWKGDGSVAIIKVAAKEDGVYSLQFDTNQTELYQNDGKATPEPVLYGVAPIALFAPQGLLIVGLVLLALLALWMVIRRKYKISFV